MKARRVRYAPTAVDDLLAIEAWLAEVTSDSIAAAYIQKIMAYCDRFDLAAERGTPRDDLMSGLRIVGFEKRVTLAFLVGDKEVVFINVFYGGQDWEAQFRDDGEA